MNEANIEQADAELEPSVEPKVVMHALGRLERVMASADGLVEVFTDDSKHVLVFYNDSLRMVVNPDFWQDAELGLVQTPEYIQLRSGGLPVVNIPLRLNILVEDDMFPEYIAADDAKHVFKPSQ